MPPPPEGATFKSVVDANLIAPERARPLRRTEYEKLVELGSFANERLELLYGTLVEMTPQGTRHSECVRRLNRELNRLLADRATVQIQSPFAATNDSEPEPDVAVVPSQDYSLAHPSSAFLIVEVADTSLVKDRKLKASLYAEAGVPEFWLVDLIAGAIEVRTEPAGGRYRKLTTHGPGETVAPRAFPDAVMKVEALLPRS